MTSSSELFSGTHPDDTTDSVVRIFNLQKQYKTTVAAHSVKLRIDKLVKLKQAILAHKKELCAAMYQDFRKNEKEVEITEIIPTIIELQHTIAHLRTWTKDVCVGTPLPLFGTSSVVHYEPKGQVLILAPWNYPFLLLIGPMIAAIAAGNCVMARASEKVPHTARFIKNLIASLFAEQEIYIAQGGVAVAEALLSQPFEHFFFTGSPAIGKKVMQAAASHLASVTLELGGKSPTIVDESADINQAAERICWGKFINAGQTCLAPDYVWVHESVATAFYEAIKKTTTRIYGATEEQQRSNQDYCRIVDQAAWNRLDATLKKSIAQGASVLIGGHSNAHERFIAPTVLTQIQPDFAAMQGEIFGPILPIMTYRSLDEVIHFIKQRPKPLALYLFSRNQSHIEKVIQSTSSGGVCINNVVIQLTNPDLPFGGVGESGMGSYHGFYGFKTFSHERAIMKQTLGNTVKLLYPPYQKRVQKMIEWLYRYARLS